MQLILLSEESSRIARIKRYPDVYYDNMCCLNNRQASIIEKYKMEEYRENFVEDQINGAYNYLSDGFHLCGSGLWNTSFFAVDLVQ